jgi:hypothetical protein
MAFTPEQEASILAFVSKASATPAATTPAATTPAATTPVVEVKTKTIAEQVKEELEASKAKSIVEQAKEAVEAEKNSQISLGQINESVRFNISITDFVEKNKNLLPEESPKILTAINSKTYKNDIEKANKTRANLLDSFLSQKDNLVVMTASMQSRAESFKNLAESDKERRSSEFWDLAEVGIALKAGRNKAEALNKINGVNAGDASGNILEQKILAAARAKFNNKK